MEEKEIKEIFNGEQFPKFQWSMFTGVNREQQFVVRSNDIDEFKANKDMILNIADFGVERPKVDDAPGEAPICGIHKVKKEWRTGTSKAGKAYAFWACPERMPDGGFCTHKEAK